MTDLKQKTDHFLALADAATPGPYAANGRRVESADEHGWVNDGWILAECHGTDSEGNTALFAAAPDMSIHLRALQAENDRLTIQRDEARKLASEWSNEGGAKMQELQAECDALRSCVIEISALVPETHHARGFSTNALIGLLEGIGRTADDAINRERI